MTKLRAIAVACVSVAVAAATLIGGSSSSAATCSWVVVPSADAGVVSELVGVGITQGIVWAAGNSTSGDEFAASKPLIERYTGTSWEIVSSPQRGSRVITDLSTVAINDAWVVGSKVPRLPRSKQDVDKTLAEFYDGTSWQTVPTPNVGIYGSDLAAISERAPGDVWAVGSSGRKSGATDPLIEHFDGTSWTVVPSPRSKKFTRALTGVAARFYTEAWAVGYERDRKDPQATDRPLVMRWDGSSWTKVKIPTPGPNSWLTDVSLLPFDGTPVATGTQVVGDRPHSFVETYDGTTWTIAPSTPAGAVADQLFGVSGVTAAGAYVDAQAHTHPMIEVPQTVGSSRAWVQQPVEDAPNGNGWLNDVTNSFSSGSSWAVGAQTDPNSSTFVPGRDTLIEHYQCTSSSPSPTSSASFTPSPTSSASFTPTPTPSATSSP